ncbi:MAG: carboxypeptidase-like regulatory domain-containing protein [Bacteroidia bacterium]
MQRLVAAFVLSTILLAQEERLTIVSPPSVRQRIAGRVIDARTGEPLMGVQVRLGSVGTYTDEKGYFTLIVERLDTLSVFLLGYRPLRVGLSRAETDLLLRLSAVETELQEVPIVAEAARETEAGLFLERLRALEIAELYSQELIMKRSTDFYVPNVLRRLPGVSLLSGRYISIRGMGERYNAFAFWAAYPAWLNYDATFSEIEQLITTLLGRVEVRKFWTPELLGHFGGGMVDFQLPQTTSEGLQIAYTTEWDFTAVGRRFPRFSSPLRSPIPAGFPPPHTIQASENNGVPTSENFQYAQRVERYTVPDSLSFAPPGHLLTVSYDRRWEKWRVSLRGAFSQRYLASAIRFDDGTFVEEDGHWHFQSYYTVKGRSNPLRYYTQGGGASWNLAFQPHPHHTLMLEGFSILSTTQRTALEQGAYINPEIDSVNPVQAYYSSFYLPRSYLAIVRPSWHFSSQGGWRSAIQAGLILQGQDIPQAGAMNYIRYPGATAFSYEHELYGSSEVYAQVWTSRVRAWQGYIHPYLERRWEGGESWLQVRLGGWYSQERQHFHGRLLGFLTDTTGGRPRGALPEEVYSLENIRDVYALPYRQPGGWYLIERTGDFHRHRGITQTVAGYAWVRLGLGPRWEALLGARYEHWQRQIWNVPIATETETTLTRLSDGHLLPAFLLKRWLGERHTLRLGANLTLVRPPFPTQVPLPYFDYLWAYYWIGEPTIRTARSYNADLRYEWLRDKDNLIAIGLFYKHLRQLPEVYLIPESYTLVFTYSSRQRRWGDIVGIEIEARKTLWQTETRRFWSYLTITVSESALERPVWRKIGRLEGRLQGHSPIVGNAGLLYTRRRWEGALFFNYTSAQIWAIGFDPYVYPHLIEEGRLVGEAQISYRLGSRWEVRLAIWDFINQPYRRTQRVGNANSFNSARDAVAAWERWAWRAYLTIRYRLG